jgi:hypothetical protein
LFLWAKKLYHQLQTGGSGDDVSNARAENTIKYQFGMTSGKVNIYNSSGVIAIIPIRNFGIR